MRERPPDSTVTVAPRASRVERWGPGSFGSPSSATTSVFACAGLRLIQSDGRLQEPRGEEVRRAVAVHVHDDEAALVRVGLEARHRGELVEVPAVAIAVEALRLAAPERVVAEVRGLDALLELLVLGRHQVPEVDLALGVVLAGEHPVDDEEVGPAVHVGVHEDAAPRPGRVPDAGLVRRPVRSGRRRGCERATSRATALSGAARRAAGRATSGRAASGIAGRSGTSCSGKRVVRDEEVEAAVAVVVVHGDAHAEAGIEDAGLLREVRERAVAVVVEVRVLSEVVGDVDVGPAVAVEVRALDREPPAGVAGARGLRDVGERAVAVVVEEVVGRRVVGGDRGPVVRMAVDEDVEVGRCRRGRSRGPRPRCSCRRARRRPWRRLPRTCRRRGCDRGGSAFRGRSRRGPGGRRCRSRTTARRAASPSCPPTPARAGGVLEGAVAAVAVQTVAVAAGEEEIGPAVPVEIEHGHARRQVLARDRNVPVRRSAGKDCGRA